MDRIMNISKWTKEDLVQVLRLSGYMDGEDIISSKFCKVEDGRASFDIAYYDMNTGNVDRGTVYVFIDATGELVADY